MNYICAELPSGKWRVYEDLNDGNRKLVGTFSGNNEAADYIEAIIDSPACDHLNFEDTLTGTRCLDCKQEITLTEEDE